MGSSSTTPQANPPPPQCKNIGIINIPTTFPHYKLVTLLLSKAHSVTDGTQQQKSSLPYQITNAKLGLTDQEGSHLGTTVSSESVNSGLNQVQLQDQ